MKNQILCLASIVSTHLHAGFTPKNSVARRLIRLSFALAILSTLNLHLSTAFAQTTAFTYQGRLATNGAAYSGSAEFQFTLWDDAAAGSVVASNNPVSVIAPVNDGLFTVTLDFGIDPFNGEPRFLQTDVRTTIGAFTTLAPRQPVTATPYALRALNLTTNGLAGTYGNIVAFDNPANSFSGGFTGVFNGVANGDGSGLTNVNALSLGGFSAASFWNAAGNTGTNPTNGAFLGTTDNLPLEFKVNGKRALRIEPSAFGAPNLIGGGSDNSVETGISDATISGGSGNHVFSGSGFQQVGAVIGGGSQNLIGSTPGSGSATFGGFNTIAGGFFNNIRSDGDFDAIGGGSGNFINTNADYDAIAGGENNSIGTNASASVIGGGTGNKISANAFAATIPGGDNNSATNHAFASGHRAKANHDGAFVWADSTEADFASTASDQFLIRASGGVGIGTTAPEAPLHVAEGSAGSVTANPGSIAVFERSGGGYLTILTPPTSERGILFGDPNSAENGGIIFNSASARSGLQFRTGTNGTRMVILANGNVGIGNSNPTNRFMVVNARCDGSSWINSSDRNLKENFTAINPREVLDKVAAMPITQWNYKTDAQSSHLGPVAQDFHAAFHLGADDVSISTVDEGGVALAAIQGLNEKLVAQGKEKDAQIQQLQKSMAELKNLVAHLAQSTPK